MSETPLKPLIEKSIFVIRETKARFKKPAVMWSTGKDSTACLHLIKEACFGEVPFPVIHIDTGYKFPEIYKFRDWLAKKWNLNLVIARNEEALKKGMGPKKYPRMQCCYQLKTMALKQLMQREKYDALIVSIRWDEHPIRGMERYFSPRDSKWHWKVVRPKTKEEMKEGDSPYVSLQDTELAGWGIFATDFGPECSHVRVHPILHWSEIEIWRYIKKRKIPFNPLYISKNGYRYRSLGCMPCTDPIKSNAKTIDEIIEELKVTTMKERVGRAQDKEKLMERLRYLGYF